MDKITWTGTQRTAADKRFPTAPMTARASAPEDDHQNATEFNVHCATAWSHEHHDMVTTWICLPL